ncbi:hypothetical protein BJY04DRAFT_40395 [Aspergillus karnatakaensis]|uniref:uncharacterized protein n=1 Tax=Aspergillus karnatakaensis TaxID=1810916 RepID=UPI003CCD7B5D
MLWSDKAPCGTQRHSWRITIQIITQYPFLISFSILFLLQLLHLIELLFQLSPLLLPALPCYTSLK